MRGIHVDTGHPRFPSIQDTRHFRLNSRIDCTQLSYAAPQGTGDIWQVDGCPELPVPNFLRWGKSMAVPELPPNFPVPELPPDCSFPPFQ